MREYIENRTLTLGEYIVENKSTVRTAAKKFGISKSTVHKDVSERLREIDRGLFEEVRAILDENKEVRHIRVGLATRKKYSEKRKNSIVKKEKM